MKEKLGKETGITLIALVITIIVLLILAGVSIAMLTGENGLLTQVQKAKKETENAQLNEEKVLDNYEQYLNYNTGVILKTITGQETSNTITQDSLENKVVVPAGFKVVNPNDNVEDGIIIEDVSHSATEGSQFVWIPVGTGIKKKDGTTFDIKLSRYTFDASGIATEQGSNAIISGEYNYQEINTGHGNTTAKENIESEDEGFRRSAIKNGGYYIGRYEARDGITTSERTSTISDTNQVVCTNDNYVYNYVTQLQAAELSRNMYNDINFESDLMSSYAWDTTIDFLQKCDDRENKAKPYSMQNSLNTSLAEKGTNNLTTTDIICNIYDMASNCYEWTTETYSYTGNSCVHRGGDYEHSYSYLAVRYTGNTTVSTEVISFRPLLYL